jgi:dolichyl-diphosphooligosaccharide--protein glycosyltransferase
MAYYGNFDRTDDYQYPDGAYGVMSWWDYGHWITVQSERIPNANPFQQGPRPASAFFQATDEERANKILEVLPSMQNEVGRIDSLSTEELTAIEDDQTAQQNAEDTRYVMIDDQMAGGKFGAITRWAGPGQAAYFRRASYEVQSRGGTQNQTIVTTTDRYRDTMLAKLYYEDADGLSHYRLVHEVNRYAVVGGVLQPSGQQGRLFPRPLRSFRVGPWATGTRQDARNLSAQLGRIRNRDVAVPVGSGAYVYDSEVESSVKVYERVEGATIQGTIGPDVNVSDSPRVTAYVSLRTATGRTFNYFKEVNATDRTFEMTVPYATSDTLGPAEGGTDQSVTATANYTVLATDGSLFAASGQARFDVPESAVVNGETIPVEVTPIDREPATNATDGNATTGGNTTATPDGSDAAENTATDSEDTPTGARAAPPGARAG